MKSDPVIISTSLKPLRLVMSAPLMVRSPKYGDAAIIRRKSVHLCLRGKYNIAHTGGVAGGRHFVERTAPGGIAGDGGCAAVV
jgi:hypothetical protein